jgi:hypothetical protein
VDPGTAAPARSRTTHIRDAAWVVAWDASTSSHVYRRDIDVVFAGDTITFVGPAYPGPADVTVDARGLLVMPGLVDIHAHPTTEPGYKGIREEHGVPEMYMTGLYERVLAFRLDEAGRRAAAEVAYAELLASGVTALADLSAPLDGWIDLVARSGLRGFLARRTPPRAGTSSAGTSCATGGTRRPGARRSTGRSSSSPRPSDIPAGGCRGSSTPPRSIPAARPCCGTVSTPPAPRGAR